MTASHLLSQHRELKEAFDVRERAEAEKLKMFKIDFCRPLLLQFFGLDPTGGDEQVVLVVDESVVCLAWLDACVAIVSQCLEEIETGGGHWQKVYARLHSRCSRLL